MKLSPTRFAGFLTTEDPRWGEVLAKAPHDFFHLPAYLKASSLVEEGEPLLFLLDTGDHGMAVPLLKRSLARFGDGFKQAYDATSPYGYGGPIYWGADLQDVLPELHARFERFLREQNIVSIFLRLNPFLGASSGLLAELGDLQIHGPSVYIDLRDSVGSWRGIHPHYRAFIKRMLRSGCDVRIDQWDTLEQVIQAYYETMERREASPFYFFPAAFFHTLKDDAAGRFHLATAFDPGGNVTGGLFFSEVGGIVHDFLAGTFTRFLPLSPNKVLINAVRGWGIRNGHHTLNLGGGLGARMDNIYHFKRLLSKSEVPFATFRKILLPDRYRALGQGPMGTEIDYFPAYRKPA
jgi:hypothetical protein